MKNILIPTDFSDNSWNAIEYALNFFENSTCNFYILHIDRISDFVGGESPYIPTEEIIDKVFTKPSKEKLEQLLKKIDKLPLNPKHRFFTQTDYNLFIDSIRSHVAEKKIDFIVMGTKGASGIKKFIIGSNTGDVITKVQCNALIIPENAKYVKPNEIAFPTDFTFFYPTETLKPISEILELHDSAIRILHINKKKIQLNDDQLRNKDYLEDYFGKFKHSFHFLTNKHIEDAIQCFVESRNIDLITMVAKNLNYFQKILFHPTVQEISYHTDVPFLVLHE
ncbi:universal stress protein [Urechidicola croceus]|uniref:Universal stress protein n=1 Tax=Urechidicola croceus TaxID=1850246 RepID=A0A1D8PBU3_9FLAO|nr:universal stress protein [Urechidicola croceus]AOW22054.1 universal stress protein [Urechidicola croceus]